MVVWPKVPQWHGIFSHDPGVMGSNHSLVELGDVYIALLSCNSDLFWNYTW